MAFSGAQETRLGLYGGPRGLYGSFAGKTPTVTATITGTAITGGVLESEIVTGSQTIIITLASDTWVAAGATFNAQRQAIIDGITSAGVEALGWNAEVRDKEVTTAVVRTSNTVATITLTAAPAYSITADETIEITIPAAALVTSAIDVTGTPTFDVTNETPAVVDTGGGPSGGASYPRVPHRWPSAQKRKKKIYEEIEEALDELSTASAAVKAEAVDILEPIVGESSFAALEERVETAIRTARGQKELRAIERKVKLLDALIDEAEVELLLL